MPFQPFDPFNDRMARDIRNTLSTALVADLGEETSHHVDEAADLWLDRRPARVYRDHIRLQRQRYREVLNTIRSQRVGDPREQSLFLWNAGLFFELHELLETIWHGTSGSQRNALKGLIQAAGVYVHRARGNLEAARNLARRAAINLRGACTELDFIADLDSLLAALDHPSSPPPVLSGPIYDQNGSGWTLKKDDVRADKEKSR